MSVAAQQNFADLLLAVWPTDTAKRAAAVAQRSHRTVQDWLQRRTTPSADVMLAMMRENEQLRAVMIAAYQGDAYATLVNRSAVSNGSENLGGEQGAVEIAPVSRIGGADRGAEEVG